MPVPPLDLPTDTAPVAPTLEQALAAAAGNDPRRRALAALMARLADAAVPLAARLARGRLPGDPKAVMGKNRSGDAQQALDMAAHHHFLRALAGLSVSRVLSEEAEDPITLDPAGQFDVVMDPIDGSGSIGIGAPLGALFAVFPRGDSFLRPGREIIAAAYVSFGHSLDLGVSLGDGVMIATHDPASGQFHVDTPRAAIPETTRMIAFNASNLRHWSPGLRGYIDTLLRGADGPRGQDANMRWIAAAVGDLHRILRRGGAFLYPADARPGYERGFLRLTYEAFPIAWLVEQAGGAATDGRRAILDLTPPELHARVPLFFGAHAELATIAAHLAPDPET